MALYIFSVQWCHQQSDSNIKKRKRKENFQRHDLTKTRLLVLLSLYVIEVSTCQVGNVRCSWIPTFRPRMVSTMAACKAHATILSFKREPAMNQTLLSLPNLGKYYSHLLVMWLFFSFLLSDFLVPLFRLFLVITLPSCKSSKILLFSASKILH